MSKKRENYPTKRTMNLFYKPDKTTKPATIALYVLFAFACLLGLSKFLVFDLWTQTMQARQTLESTLAQLSGMMEELADYGRVQEEYSRYSSTEEEQELIDRMEVLALLDSAAGEATLNAVSINGSQVQVQLSGVTLAQTAGIVTRLEESPLVASTWVDTAATTQDTGALVQTSILIQLQKEENAP